MSLFFLKLKIDTIELTQRNKLQVPKVFNK